jgi:hypothetical protein
MNRKTAIGQWVTVVFCVVLISGSIPASAFDVVTIVGKVNGTNQIVVDEEIYEVDDTPRGNELVKNHIGQKVKVTGKLRIEGDMRVLEVTEFEVVKATL